MNLKSLSELLNLSPTTVSRALNGFPEVSEATRVRVQEAAQKYNYHPNAKAKGLATGHTHAIGHVIPVSTRHEMVNPVFADFLAGASKAYLKAHYDMLLSLVDDEDELSTYRALSARGRVDGMIVHGPRMDDGRVELLNQLGLPFVVHGRMCESEGYSWVDVDNEDCFGRATNLLLDLGHRRIALINGLESMVFADHRRRGYTHALTKFRIELVDSLMAAGEMTEPFGFASATHMLSQETPPTAFLVSSMLMAIGVRRAVEAQGLRVGQDISIVAYDDVLSYLTDADDAPQFTSMRSSVRDAGRRCAEILIDLISNPSAEPIQELWYVSLIVGASTAPPPKERQKK